MEHRGVVFRVLRLHLENASDDVAQLEAAWCVTNLAMGDDVQSVEVLPFAPVLAKLLGGDNRYLQEQAAHGLANMAADCDQARRAVRKLGVMPVLVDIVESGDDASPSVLEAALFALCSLLKGIDAAQCGGGARAMLARVARAATRLLAHANDVVCKEAAWVLAYVTACGPDAAKMALAASAVGALFALLARQGDVRQAPPSLVIASVRVLGNFVCTPPAIAEQFVERCHAPLLRLLRPLLHGAEHRAVVKEASFVVANLAASGDRARQLLRDANFVDAMFHVFDSFGVDVRREIAFALMNMAHANIEFDRIARHCIAGFLQLIGTHDLGAARLGIDFCQLVLAKHPDGIDLVEQADGIEALESVHHESPLRSHAMFLVDQYFD
jgi:hypothetical protein